MNFHGFGDDLSQNFEETVVFVGGTMSSFGLEVLDDLNDLGTHGGLKEFSSISHKSLCDDGPDVVQKSENHLVFFQLSGDGLKFSFSLSFQGLKDLFSLSKTGLFVA